MQRRQLSLCCAQDCDSRGGEVSVLVHATGEQAIVVSREDDDLRRTGCHSSYGLVEGILVDPVVVEDITSHQDYLGSG
jgi:hypothetical protein